jgi:excisionase family DNA binding protein
METKLPRLLTIQDVALWLACPTRQVVRWAKAGELPFITLPDGELMFEQSELAAWIELRRNGDVGDGK